jgi:hypothetical protein
MATACIPQVTFGFEPKAKPIVATFAMKFVVESSTPGMMTLSAGSFIWLEDLPLVRVAGIGRLDGDRPRTISHMTRSI